MSIRWKNRLLASSPGHSRSSKVTGISGNFLLVIRSNYEPVSYRFRDERRFPSKSSNFSYALYLTHRWYHCNFVTTFWRYIQLCRPAFNEQTGGRTDRWNGQKSHIDINIARRVFLDPMGVIYKSAYCIVLYRIVSCRVVSYCIVFIHENHERWYYLSTARWHWWGAVTSPFMILAVLDVSLSACGR